MAKAEARHIFNISADQLWDLIGDFGNTPKWSGSLPDACVQQGEGIGSLRTLTFAGDQKIVDRLEEVGERSYSSSIVSSPLPVSAYKAKMAVVPLDASSCELTWSGEFEPAGISDIEAISFFENVYRSGIGLMVKSIVALSRAR